MDTMDCQLDAPSLVLGEAEQHAKKRMMDLERTGL